MKKIPTLKIKTSLLITEVVQCWHSMLKMFISDAAVYTISCYKLQEDRLVQAEKKHLNAGIPIRVRSSAKITGKEKKFAFQ
jgi:hypothetical protein